MLVSCAECKKKLKRKPSRTQGRNYCGTTCQMRYEYTHGIRDGAIVVRAAHKVIRRLGHYKRDETYLKERNPARTPAAREKISQSKKKANWMRGRTGKNHHNWKGGKIWWRGKEWSDLKKKIRKRDKNRCIVCGMSGWKSRQRFQAPLQVDHIVPYRVSKNNHPSNLQTLCNTCHGKKSGRGL